MTSQHIHLGVALDGAGWHPSAWREPSSRPGEIFAPAYWADLVRRAARGLLDFVTFEDALALQSSDRILPDERVDEVRGRLDALVLANALAPVTEHIGLIPVVTTTFTEPFHISTGVATLDYTSLGRAGFQPRLSFRAEEVSHVGRGELAVPESIEAWAASADAKAAFEDAAEVVDAIRRLWDSWEDDAEIRDAATDRFIDADKLHTIDFAGARFSIRGPSIVPRPPQGQPIVAALAHREEPYRFAAKQADLVFTTPAEQDVPAVLGAVREAERQAARAGEPLRVFADLLVLLDDPAGEKAVDRLGRLDGLGRSLVSDARIVAGSATGLADVIEALAGAGYDGVRLRPGVATDDLARIVDDLVPELQRRGLFRTAYPASGGLRGLLGLPETVPNRYAGQTGRISPAPAAAL